MILVAEKLDLLIVPGGWDTRKEVKNDKLVTRHITPAQNAS